MTTTNTQTGTIIMPALLRAASLGVRLRSVGETDAAFLEQVYRSTREEELSRTGWSEAQKAAFIAMQFHAQDRHYRQHYPVALWLIVEHHGQPVGRLYLERWESEHRIIDIALLPVARGRGLGTALLRDLLDEAAGLQRRVGIHVEKMNPAMTLYRRLGFRTVADKGVHDLLEWSAAAPGDQVKTDSY